MLNATHDSSHKSQGPESLYQEIVESQTDLICRFLPDGSLTFVNQAFCQHYQKSRQELLGSNFLLLLPSERRANLQSNILDLRPANPQFSIEITNHTLDGKTYWQHWTDLGIFDQTGNLVEIQSTGHDITDIRLAEISAERYAREMSSLHNATTALLKTLDLETLLGYILDAAIGAISRAETGMLYLIARDTGKLEMRAMLGFEETDPRIQKLSNPESVRVVARAVHERTPLLITDLEEHSTTARSSYTFIVAPLILEDHVLGAISLQTTRQATFTQADLRLLTNFAATATTAIQNAQLHAEVQRQSITDELTGLYNRRGFYEFGEREVQRGLRFERPLTAILLDIDNLKPINDNFGHDAGDRLLRYVARQCITKTRKVDIVSRYGGDELAILLPETDLYAAANVAERLRVNIAGTSLNINDTSIQVTVSLGVAKMTPDIKTLVSLIQRADKALYIAKRSGKNRVEIR